MSLYPVHHLIIINLLEIHIGLFRGLLNLLFGDLRHTCIRDIHISCGHSTVGINLLADQISFIVGHSLFDLRRWTFIIGPSSWDNQFQTFRTFIYVGILHHIKSLHGLLLRTISELAITFIIFKSTDSIVSLHLSHNK